MLLALLSSQASLNSTPSSLVLQGTDKSAVASTDAFLSSHLRYTRDVHGQDICLLELDDGQEVGVMMGWERDISECSSASHVQRQMRWFLSAENGGEIVHRPRKTRPRVENSQCRVWSWYREGRAKLAAQYSNGGAD
jgi:hypothetical protein